MTPTDVAKLALGGTVSSAVGAASAAAYGHFIPKTFKDVMRRHGGLTLATDTDFQSILFDQKEKVDAFVKEWAPSGVRDKAVVTDADKLPELKSWCQTKASQRIETVPDLNKYSDYYLNLCTTKGIKTVKGFLTKSRSYGNWIEDKGTQNSEKELSYKGVFSVYKNSDDFLKWINEKKSGTSHSEQITKTTTNEKGYPVLKEICERDLKHSWSSLTEGEMNNYYFFCTAFKDDTVKGRLKAQDPTWTERTTWTGVKDKWYQTDGIKATIMRTNSTEPLQDSDYQTWCTSFLAARLGSKEETYPTDYAFAKQICREDTTQPKS